MSCPFCGSAASGGVRSCPTCGGVIAPSAPRPAAPSRRTAPVLLGDAERCWSCAGARDAKGPCPWCAAPAEALAPLDPEVAAAQRQRSLFRGAVVGAVALLVLSIVAAAAVGARTGRLDDAWQEDRAEAAGLVKDLVEGLELEPGNADDRRMRQAADRLEAMAVSLEGGEGHEGDRRRLAEHLYEFRRGFDRLGTLVVRGPARISENVVSSATSVWDGLSDDADGIAELTGVRIDVGSARAKIDAFVEASRRAAHKAAVEAHREEVLRAMDLVVPVKADLDRSGIASREAGPALFGLEFELATMGRARRDAARRLRAAQAPTTALGERVEGMAAALDDAADALEGLRSVDGGCEVRTFFEYVCPKIGELPAYKEVVAKGAAADAKLAAERHAWAVEVDAEIARSG